VLTNACLIIIVEASIIDEFNKTFFKLKESYSNTLSKIKVIDEPLFLCLKSVYCVETEDVILPPNFCSRCKAASVDLVNVETTNLYLELRRGENCFFGSKTRNYIYQLIDWFFWTTNIFIILSERETHYRPIPVVMSKVKAINGVLSECKLNYLTVLEEIKELDAGIYTQLVSCFDPFSKHVPLSSDFPQRLEAMVNKINIEHLGKCKQILVLDNIPIADIAEWEIIPPIFGFVASFYMLLEEAIA